MPYFENLKEKNPIVLLFFWTLLALFSLVLFNFSSLLIISFIYDLPNLSVLQSIENLNNNKIILALKVLQIINSIALFIIPCFLFAYLIKEKFLILFKLNKKLNIISIILLLGLMFALTPLIDWMSYINNKMALPDFMSLIEKWMKESEIYSNKLTIAFLCGKSTSILIVNLFMIGILPAIGEELVFRGLLQSYLTKLTKNVHWSITITSIIFSAIHLQFYGFFPRMFLGVLLGYLFIWSNNLWLPIAAHLINNSSAVIVAFFIGTKNIVPDIENHETKINTSLLISSVLISICLIYLIYKQEKNKLIPFSKNTNN